MHRSGAACSTRSRSARRSATRPSAGWSPGCSARRSSSPRCTIRAQQGRPPSTIAERLIDEGELYGDEVDRAARRRPGCASPRSTCWTRRHGPRSDPAALPRRPPVGGPERERERLIELPPEPTLERRAAERAGRRRAEPLARSATASASSLGALRRRRVVAAVAVRRCCSATSPQRRRRASGWRPTGRPGSRPTSDPTRRRGRDRRPRRRASTAQRRQQLVDVERATLDPDAPARPWSLRSRRGGDDPHLSTATACCTPSTGSGTTARSRRQAVAAAPRAGAPRGARARALHVPLPHGRRRGGRAAARRPCRPGRAPSRPTTPTPSPELQAVFYRPGDLKPQLRVAARPDARRRGARAPETTGPRSRQRPRRRR